MQMKNLIINLVFCDVYEVCDNKEEEEANSQ